MSVIGFITRSGGSDFFSQGVSNVGATGGVRYVARYPDGTSLGNFRSAGEAISAFRRLAGADRIYQVRRRDLPSNVEHYEVISDPPDPSETWGQNLKLWSEPDFLTKVVFSDSDSKLVQSIKSNSTGRVRLIQPTEALQGTLVEGNSNFKGRASLSLSADGYPVPNLTVNSAVVGEVRAPFTVVVAANRNTIGNRFIVRIDAGPPFELGDDGTGRWVCNSGAGTVVGPLISTTKPDVVTAIQSIEECVLRVNGVVVGVAGDLPDPGPLFVSQPAFGLGWDGDWSFIALANIVGSTDQIQLTERYARQKYC